MRPELRDLDARDPILSPRATRIGLLVLVPLAVVFGVQTISWAVPKIWSPGDTLTASDLNQNFKALEDQVAAVSAALSAANPWVKCGKLEDLRTGANRCEIAAFPVDQYEYGFKYVTAEVMVATCTFWNVGLRVFNRDPYMVNSDDPSGTAMALGGAIFYTETLATDDDIPGSCPSGTWRQRYWAIVSGNVVTTGPGLGTQGCANLDLYCRRR